MDRDTALTPLKDLIALARGALASRASENPEEILAALDAYLSAFEQWQTQISAAGPGEQALAPFKDEAKPILEQLAGLHAEVTRLAAESRDKLGAVLGDVHKRSQGLKRYLDPHPSRITIAGKREG